MYLFLAFHFLHITLFLFLVKLDDPYEKGKTNLIACLLISVSVPLQAHGNSYDFQKSQGVYVAMLQKCSIFDFAIEMELE